jgi:hypothetical protein
MSDIQAEALPNSGSIEGSASPAPGDKQFFSFHKQFSS